MNPAIAKYVLMLGLLTACAAPRVPQSRLVPAAAPQQAGTSATAIPPTESLAHALARASTQLDSATRAPYRSHLNAAEGVSYVLQPERSEIRIYAFRDGAIGVRLGHNHVISLPQFVGLAWAPEKGLRGGTADFQFQLVDVALDTPALRQETGGTFGNILKDSDVKGTLEHLLGEQGFQVARFPTIAARLVVETGETPVAIADLALTLHGETHHQRVVLKLSADAQHIEAQGSLAFRQGDFGLKPYAMLGGMLAVDELVAVSFTLRGSALRAGQL